MASYQNTSVYYCGATMDTCPENYSDTSVYYNQNPGVYQTHVVADNPENVQNQAIHPGPHPVSHLISNQEPRPYRNVNCMAKRHRAQISILPTCHGSFKASIKRKRQRTMFTTEQVQALEDIFKSKQYISREERHVIVNNLKLQDKAVKLWFQNRRLKSKRLENQNSEEQEDCSSEISSRLDFVESEICKKTDKNGFVTLDDGIMKELGSLIDAYLTKNCLAVPEEAPIYEAISPASAGEEDNFVSWKPPSDIEPSASFQRLLDLKNMPFL